MYVVFVVLFLLSRVRIWDVQCVLLCCVCCVMWGYEMFVVYCCIVFVVTCGDMRCLVCIVVLVLLSRVGIWDVCRVLSCCFCCHVWGYEMFSVFCCVVFVVTCVDMRCLVCIVVLVLLSRVGIWDVCRVLSCYFCCHVWGYEMLSVYCCVVFVVMCRDMRCLSCIVVLFLLSHVGIWDVCRVLSCCFCCHVWGYEMFSVFCCVVFVVTCVDMRCLVCIDVLVLLSRVGIWDV